MDLGVGLAILIVLFLLFRWWGRSKPAAKSTASATSQPRTSREPVADARWIKPSETVVVAGTSVARGLFYFGTSLPAQYGYGNSHALINPSLRAASRPGNVAGTSVPYYPSYSNLDPGSRRAFLDWLASPRNDPATYIGYVFLYFYGLERRLILDNASHEAPTIVAEVRRLLSVYGSNGSFHSYASLLLDAAAALSNSWPRTPLIDPDHVLAELPLHLRGAIGQLIQRQEAITADWALAWYLASPNHALRTSAKRCFSEFTELFRQRFATAYPHGLPVRAPRRHLSATYRAASGEFTVNLKGEFEKLPDIVALSAPLADIDRIATECSSALDSYSRFVGRNPDAKNTAAAELMLPDELVRNAREGSAIASLKKKVETLVPRTLAMVGYSELRDLVLPAPSQPDKTTKSEAVAVATAMQRLGFAMEPDPRHGGPTPAVDARVSLFRPQAQALSASLSAQFFAARVYIEITALIAGAEGQIDDSATKAIIAKIKSVADLSDFERVRLIGYLSFLLYNPPSQQIIARFKQRNPEERKIIARTAVAAAAMDGRLPAEEVRLLERTYKILGVEKSDLYRELHTLSGEKEQTLADGEPPTVSPAKYVPGIPIPSKSQTNGEGRKSKLDKSKIARIQSDTIAVQAILGEVFDEGDAGGHSEAAPAAVDKQPSTSSASDVSALFPGLDHRHALLLRDISSRDVVDQATFAALARQHGLFPAGAIETINEWAFERFEEPILDEGEPIEIAHHLIRVKAATSTSEYLQ